MTKESRDELLERILEETARKPYKPGTAQARRASQVTARQAVAERKNASAPATANYQKSSEQYTEHTQVFSNANALEPMVNNNVRYERETAADKIQKIKQEKAAAAKAAIMRKAEIDNSIMQQNADAGLFRQEQPAFSDNYNNYDSYDENDAYDDYDENDGYNDYDENNDNGEYDGYDEYDDEKVNIVMSDEEYDNMILEEFRQAKNCVVVKIHNIVQLVLCVFFVCFVIFNFIFPIAGVSGDSMLPTLKDGDKLLTSSIYTPQRGDVVVINNKTAALIDENGNVTEKSGLNCMISKRIIALGGDTVDFDFENGTVTVNGEVLNEGYISEPTTRDEGAFEYPLTIPQGYVFVLGDNRNISKDSRHSDIGLIPQDEISGKVIMKIYPFGSIGGVE